MLMGGRQVALNGVIEALLEAAHAHAQAAEELGTTSPGPALDALAERRQGAALEVADHMRRLGDLPAEPDADLQTARDVLARLQTALADDVRDQLLQHCRDTEDHLAKAVQVALEEDLGPETRSMLEDLLALPELRAALGLA